MAAKVFFRQNPISLVWEYGTFKIDGITPDIELTLPSGLYRSRWEVISEVYHLTIINSNNLAAIEPFNSVAITDIASDLIGTAYANRAAFELATIDFFNGSSISKLIDDSGNSILPSGIPVKLASELTRPTDTPGAYSAGDAINSSVATPVITELTGASISNGGGGIGLMIKLESNMTALAGQTIRLWFYNDIPASLVGDHVAFINSYANATKRCFYVDVTFDPLLAGSDTVIGMADITKEYITKATGTSLYCLLQTLTSWTPTSGGKIYIGLSVVKLS